MKNKSSKIEVILKKKIVLPPVIIKNNNVINYHISQQYLKSKWYKRMK
jgi:hypothetical protein